MHAQEYNPADVAVINALIANNGLIAAKNAPGNWRFATWNNSIPKNIIKLNLNDEALYGEASFSELTQLQVLKCNRNGLTKLDVTKCTQLQILTCSNNRLTKLDVTGCKQLYWLDCKKNRLTELDVSKCIQLYWLGCENNNLTELDVSNCTKMTSLTHDDGVKRIVQKKTEVQPDRVEQIVIVSNTSFSSFVQTYVIQEMNKWMQKGEFEKTDKWQQRICEDSRKERCFLRHSHRKLKFKTLPRNNLTD